LSLTCIVSGLRLPILIQNDDGDDANRHGEVKMIYHPTGVDEHKDFKVFTKWCHIDVTKFSAGIESYCLLNEYFALFILFKITGMVPFSNSNNPLHCSSQEFVCGIWKRRNEMNNREYSNRISGGSRGGRGQSGNAPPPGGHGWIGYCHIVSWHHWRLSLAVTITIINDDYDLTRCSSGWCQHSCQTHFGSKGAGGGCMPLSSTFQLYFHGFRLL